MLHSGSSPQFLSHHVSMNDLFELSEEPYGRGMPLWIGYDEKSLGDKTNLVRDDPGTRLGFLGMVHG